MSIYRCQTQAHKESFLLLFSCSWCSSTYDQFAIVWVFATSYCNYTMRKVKHRLDKLMRKRQSEREKGQKKKVVKSLIFIIQLGANLMHTTHSSFAPPKPTLHPVGTHPTHTRLTSGRRVPPRFLPLSACYLHTYQKYLLLERNPSTATSNFHLGTGLDWIGLDWTELAGCSTISCLFP